MPLFEVGNGRARLVQPMQPQASTFGAEVTTILADHLAGVLAEPLFVVRTRTSGDPDDDRPTMLALDGAGRPVVVDVVHVLDHDALVAALRRAGAAARLTPTDLARAYHPTDPTRFGADFAAYRDARLLVARRSADGGPRVVLVCADVAPEAVDAVGFWRTRGDRLDVLQVGVVRGEDGRRLLTVAPLAHHEPSRRAVEPTGLRLVHAANGAPVPADATQALPLLAARTTGITETTRDARPPAPAQPAAAPLVAPVPAPAPVPAAPVVASSATPGPAPATTTSGSIPAPAPARGPVTAPVRAAGGPPEPAPAVPAAPAPAPAVPAAPAPVAPAPVAPAPVAPAPVAPAPAPAVPVAPAAPHRAAEPLAVPPPPTRAPSAPAVPGPPSAPQPSTGRPPAARASRRAAGGPQAYPELVELADATSAPTPLVWLRLRRGQRLVAWLREDGLITITSGATFDDPSAAAAAAAETEAEVDGWRSWRFGDDGPTLAEAIAMLHRG